MFVFILLYLSKELLMASCFATAQKQHVHVCVLPRTTRTMAKSCVKYLHVVQAMLSWRYTPERLFS